jgi:hypothetical protein
MQSSGRITSTSSSKKTFMARSLLASAIHAIAEFRDCQCNGTILCAALRNSGIWRNSPREERAMGFFEREWLRRTSSHGEAAIRL